MFTSDTHHDFVLLSVIICYINNIPPVCQPVFYFSFRQVIVYLTETYFDYRLQFIKTCDILVELSTNLYSCVKHSQYKGRKGQYGLSKT